MEESGTAGKGRRLAARLQGLIAALVGALLLVLSFPPFNVAEAAYVFAVPLLLHALFTKPQPREGAVLYLSGWMAWVAIIFWLRNFSLHLGIPFAAALGWLSMLAVAAVLALFWWAWWAAALYLVRRGVEQVLPARIGILLALAGLWVLLEWIRGILFSGFPWMPLSTSQWQRPLILQVASLTGGHGVSFVLVAFNLGLAFYLHNLWHNRKATWWRRLSLEFYTGLLLLFAAIAFGLYSSGAGSRERIPGPRLGFVQPDAGAVEKWDPDLMRENLALLDDLTTYAAYLGADLILWPESQTPLPVKGNASMQAWVEELTRESGKTLLIGNVAREGAADDPDRKWYNAVFLVDPATGVHMDDYYAKRHLVPFGEYVPLQGWIPFIRKVVPVEGEFVQGISARPLELEAPSGVRERVGVLICYEDIFPGLARENTLAGADWHFVATNNVWYGEEAGAWQHAAHSVLRAVETRRPVVRCGNAGWSGWIDEYGHIRHVMLDNEGSIYFQGVEAVDFSRSSYWNGRLSPYVRYGDWFVGACAMLVMAGLGLSRLPGKRSDPAAVRRRTPLRGLLRGGTDTEGKGGGQHGQAM